MPQAKIKFSIVTVCLNAQDTILETIRSVQRQNYTNYEYIIWDGKSADDTMDIIRRNAQAENITICSEQDSGLYNAMNKAIEKCDGDYVLFLNSGDVFIDEKVLLDVADVIEQDQRKAELYFGNVFRKMENSTVLETYRGKNIVLRLLLAGRMPCHQSMFTDLELMKQYHFDESYSITADYNFLMKCHRYGHLIKYIDRNICCFDCTQGISSMDSNLEKMRRQDDRSMKELYPGWYYLLRPVKKLGRWWKDRARKQGELL